MRNGGGSRDLLPGKTSDPGRTAADNRLFVNGVLWVLRSGAHWHDLPERYGKWKSRAQALRALGQGRRVGAVFEHLSRSRQRLPHARHHAGPRPPAGGGRKRGARNRLWGVPEED